MVRLRTRSLAAVIFLSSSLAGAAAAQQAHESRELVIGGLGPVDDIEWLASGEILASLPGQGIVARIDQQQVITPIYNGLVNGMALEPGGQALWVADFVPGTLKRIDLQTLQVTQTLSGFEHPLEIVFVTPTEMLVGSLTQTNYQTSPGIVRRVSLVTPPVPPVVLTTSIVGGMDVVMDAQSRLFLTSLGSSTLDEIDTITGQVTPVVGPVFQCADLLLGPGATIYASTLLLGEILRIDPAGPSVTQLAALVGGAGPGCEDMAIDGSGNVLVALNSGEIWRVRVSGELVQAGPGFSGFPFVMLLDVPAMAGRSYALTASLGLGSPLPVPGTGQFWLPAPDPLFFLTVQPGNGIIFNGFGTLDASGRGVAFVAVPVLSPGTVAGVWFGGVTYQGAQILDVIDPLHVVIGS